MSVQKADVNVDRLRKALSAIDKMQSKLSSIENRRIEPLAIVGMSCRLPGYADTPELFWKNLIAEIDTVTEIPASRWDINDYYDETPGVAGKMYTKYGAFIDKVDEFDAGFFGISPREATMMDPQQRLLLESTWEALENASIVPGQTLCKNTGVFVGVMSQDYSQLTNDPEIIDVHTGSGNIVSVIAGRLAYLLGLQGPTLTVDTACSSSLVAAHLACQSLRLGECDTAIVGGVNLMLTPIGNIVECSAKMLSEDGHCKTFDDKADGFVRGEGCGAIILKRLSDAQKDNDQIIAVIRGSGVNHVGKSSGLTVPSGHAQNDVITRALNNGKVSAGDIDYVEAHGTGTSLGDPVEVESLAYTYANERSKSNPLIIGSVKTNIGHLEGAAGIVGLMKVALSLHNKTLPAHLNFSTPNKNIPWDRCAVKVNTKTTHWDTKHKTRMAGVSSFGFSGTNAHAIVEEAPILDEVVDDSKPDRKQHLLTLSAKNEKALKGLAQKYVEFLNTADTVVNLGDISYTSHIGRSHFNHRLSVVGDSKQQWVEQLDNYLNVSEQGKYQGVVANKSKKIAFLYTGQGSQYPDMCKEIFETEQIFRESLLNSESLLSETLEHTLTDVLYGIHQDKLNQTQYTQPALFAIEIALTELWKSWGIQPDFVMGHSLGEYVAACERGVMTIEEGLKLVSERGRLMQALPDKGSMLSVLGNEQTIIDIIKNIEGLDVSAFNAPGNLVISGEKNLLNEAEDALMQAGVKCKTLNVATAFHSVLIEPMLDDFAKVLDKINLQPAKKGFISNITGHEARAEVSHKNYWLKHIREAVNYRAGIDSLIAVGVSTFIEIGSQPVLLGLARQSVDDDSSRWLPSVRKNNDSHKVLMDALAELYISGAGINWAAVDQSYSRKKTHLPTYAFQRQRYWVAEQKTTSLRKQRNQGHSLLGEKIKLAQNNTEDTWFSQIISANQPGFLNDHKVYEQVIFPAAGYIEMAIAAGQALFKTDKLLIENVRLLNALFLTEDQEVQTLIKAMEADQYEFEIYSQQSDDWVLHASGNIKAIAVDVAFETESLDTLKARIIEPESIDELYAQYKKIGIDYGVTFQSIEEITGGKGETLARICLPLGSHQDKDSYHLHPALLDGAFQGLMAVGFEESSDDTYVPVGIKAIQYFGSKLTKGWCHAVLEDVNEQNNEHICNLTIFDDLGFPVAVIKGLELKKISKNAYSLNKPQSVYDHFYHIDWLLHDSKSSVADSEDGYYLICAEDNELASSVALKIQSSYESSEVININDKDALGKIIERLSCENNACKGVLYLPALSASSSLDALKRNSEQVCDQLLKLVQSLLSINVIPQLWVVTQQAQHIVKTDQLEGVDNSQLWGMGRVITLEHPELKCKRIDIDGYDAENIANNLFEELHNSSHENEIAYRDGKRYVSRLSKFNSASNALLDQPSSSGYRLDITERGTLDNIYLRPFERSVLEANEVEIHIQAAAMNFRDVLNALDMYPGDAGLLGGECAGDVVAIGENVKHLKVGDRVLGIAPGSFGNYVTVDANMIAKMADCLSYQQACAVPIVFLTTHYTLNHLGKLKAGEKILIHAATGGIGQAAVQLAQKVGAEIYATASIGKWDVLEKLGVKHKMNSRSLDFVDDIYEKTSGKGIDLVLNSLSGEYIEKTASVMKDQGRFIEIGKRDVWTEEEMAERAPHLQYHQVDLVEVCERDPALIQAMLNKLMEWFDAGELKPPQLTEFYLSEYLDAFRYMQQTKHTGKIVLRIPQAQEAISVKDNGSYLITGGLGGLGRLATQWLIDKGAGHVVLVSRRKANKEAQSFVDNYQGRVSVVSCDIANNARLNEVVQELESQHGELKGIIHAAGVLSDGVIQQQDWNNYEAVFEPKVWGTWNLHNATKDKSLDFFVLFSSMASMLGSPGQSNYAAANNYMDQFAAWRQAQGYPALSINWGPWDEVGMAASSSTVNARIKSQGVNLITPDEGVDMFDKLFYCKQSNIAAIPFEWSVFLQNFDDIPFYENFYLDGQDNNAKFFILELNELEVSERARELTEFVVQQTAYVMGFSDQELITESIGFFDLGMDSLMAVELRNLLQKYLSVSLPSTIAFDYPNVEKLVSYLKIDVLDIDFGESDSGNQEPEALAKNDESLSDLSKDELADMLEHELNELSSE